MLRKRESASELSNIAEMGQDDTEGLLQLTITYFNLIENAFMFG